MVDMVGTADIENLTVSMMISRNHRLSRIIFRIIDDHSQHHGQKKKRHPREIKRSNIKCYPKNR